MQNKSGSKKAASFFSGQNIAGRCRFPVNEVERRYYTVICELGHSQWKCFPAIKLFKTTVSYQSLGESVEPNGHVDNFFVAGWCRKLFEDRHPRRSKKHYFYPKVGVRFCLFIYLK